MRLPLALILAAYAIVHVGKMVSLHPYQYVYYNRLVGGLAGANGRFETDYWGESYREAVLRLSAHLEEETGSAALAEQARRYRVFVEGPRASATYYFSANLDYVDRPDDADFIISFTRYSAHREHRAAKELIRIEREDTPLSYVFDRRGSR